MTVLLEGAGGIGDHVSLVALGFFGALLLARTIFSSRGSILVLFPVALAWATLYLIAYAIPSAAQLHGSFERFEKVLTFHILSLGIVVLLLDWVAKPSRVSIRVLIAYLILIVPALAAAWGIEKPSFFLAEQCVFGAALIAGVALSARTNRGRVTGKAFFALLLGWNLALMMVLWPVAWVFLISSHTMGLGRAAGFILVFYILRHVVIGAVGGLGLFALELPFLAVVFGAGSLRSAWRALGARESLPSDDVAQPGPESPPRMTPVAPGPVGLAMASLILGILATALSFILVGAVLGVVGGILGIVHLKLSRTWRAMAWWGVALSIVGFAAGAGFGYLYYNWFASLRESVGDFGQDEDQLKAWEGVRAPDFTATTTDGKTITLSEFKGKRVVIDLWATWCPPCRKEIPHFVQLVKDLPQEQLAVIGASDEEKDVVTKFASENNVNYPMLAEAKLPPPYNGAGSIPTTFIVDRNGVIQTVLTGYHDIEDLRKECTAPDFTGIVKDKADGQGKELTPPETPGATSSAWTIPDVHGGSALCSGDWDGDGGDELLVADRERELRVIGKDGVEKKRIHLPDVFEHMEVGHYGADNRRLLGMALMKSVLVTDETGAKLWSYDCWTGIDGAHWGDLDGDGIDEMIVGMNGFSGLHAVSAEGKCLWKNTKIGNVWNQAVIPATPDRPAQIYTTDATGQIRQFNKDGEQMRNFRPLNSYCTELSAALMDGKNAVQVITKGKPMSSRDSEDRVIVCDDAGHVLWTARCDDTLSWTNRNFAVGDLNRDGNREWAYLETSTSLVVASMTGHGITTLPVPGQIADFTVMNEASGDGLLVVLDRKDTLTAYKVQ